MTSAKITMYPQAIEALMQAMVEAVEDTGNDLIKDVVSAQVIPKRTGALEDSLELNSEDKQSGRVHIVQEIEYGTQQYYSPSTHFSKEINANARGLWWQDWIDGYRHAEALAHFARNFRKHGGAYIK